MEWTIENQELTLERFFNDCLRFWERELNVDSDLDREPYINAIKEIPHYNPYVLHGELIDEDVRRRFIRHRLMDCYGRDWESHLCEVN